MADYIEVTVSTVPGSPKTVLLNGSHTVGDALQHADLTERARGKEIRVHDELVSLDTTLEDGDTVLVFLNKVKGN